MKFDPDPMFKFNPYPVLLVTGVLMFATVFLAQIGSGLRLARVGAVSVDRDLSTFVAKTRASMESTVPADSERPGDERSRPDRTRRAGAYGGDAYGEDTPAVRRLVALTDHEGVSRE